MLVVCHMDASMLQMEGGAHLLPRNVTIFRGDLNLCVVSLVKLFYVASLLLFSLMGFSV